MNQNKKYFVLTLGITLISGAIIYSILIFIGSAKVAKQSNYKKADDAKDTTSQDDKSIISSANTEVSTLIIPKIDVEVPINFNIDGNMMEEYMKSLETGVAHMAKTTLPGGQGNSVIFGHSSYYADKPGNYKEIFSKLNELSEGDEIRIESESLQLSYKVTEKKIVDPKDISVVNQDSSAKKITLITCWPIKTTEKRLVVAATTN